MNQTVSSSPFVGKRYAIFGLARSGCATAAFLHNAGADIVAWDDDEKRRHAFDLAPLVDLYKSDFSGLDALILSPGIPLGTHILAQKARSAGVCVVGDIELFARLRPALPMHRLVAITGTNGKSTTTALLHHILVHAGENARMGGNIGLPVLGRPPLAQGGIYVLELSSFQLDLTQNLDADIAILLNLTPDHLDRYGDMASYCASKARLFSMQSSDHLALISSQDHLCHTIGQNLHNRQWIAPETIPLLMEQENWPCLQGAHNAFNAAAAILACRALCLSDDTIRQGLETYPGLPHRMEYIATKKGVRYINDSKATNFESAAFALGSWHNIHWILGGEPKEVRFDTCLAHLSRVKQAYTIGSCADSFAKQLEAHGTTVTKADYLEKAVALAAHNAQQGDVVLLSPACASYDQFTDFEARGDAFRSLVEALAL